MLLTMMRWRPSRSEKYPAIGRHGEAGGLQGEHARADPFGRVAHLPGQVERKEREQRALRRRAERRAGGNHDQRSVLQQLAQIFSRAAHPVATSLPPRGCVGAEIEPADQKQNNARHQHAGNDVDDDDIAPAHAREQKTGGKRRQCIAHIAAHAVDRNHEAFALRKRTRQQRDRGRVPKIVADADQARTAEQRPIRMREAHQQVGCADPAQRQRHEQPFARHRIGDHAAGNVGQRSADKLTSQDRADLAVAQAQFVADERQQQIERRRIPMGEHVAERDQPDVGKRTGSNGLRRGDRRRNFDRAHAGSVVPP